MGQRGDFQKRNDLPSTDVEFDLSDRMAVIQNLRERVHLAEAACAGKIFVPPKRPTIG